MTFERLVQPLSVQPYAGSQNDPDPRRVGCSGGDGGRKVPRHRRNRRGGDDDLGRQCENGVWGNLQRRFAGEANRPRLLRPYCTRGNLPNRIISIRRRQPRRQAGRKFPAIFLEKRPGRFSRPADPAWTSIGIWSGAESIIACPATRVRTATSGVLGESSALRGSNCSYPRSTLSHSSYARAGGPGE